MQQRFEWLVIGAGPAGIASVGKLVDAGVESKEIAWIDPKFEAGDFGTSWRYVGSNTPVEYFLKYYRHCQSFCYSDMHSSFFIDKLPPEKNCPLMVAAEPLRWITEFLRKSVTSIPDGVRSLVPMKDSWQVNVASGKVISAKKIILAIGGEPRQINFTGMQADVVSLKSALSPTELRKVIQPDDTVAVFGSAQSAKSVLENLKGVEAKKIVHFYRSEYSHSRHLGESSLEHVESVKMTSKSLLAQIPECTKTICAIGFQRRHIPIIGLSDDYEYDRKTGEIAPGIFGIGMAFPEILPYELGQAEYRVTSIWPFMSRLKKLMPVWLG